MYITMYWSSVFGLDACSRPFLLLYRLLMRTSKRQQFLLLFSHNSLIFVLIFLSRKKIIISILYYTYLISVHMHMLYDLTFVPPATCPSPENSDCGHLLPGLCYRRHGGQMSAMVIFWG